MILKTEIANGRVSPKSLAVRDSHLFQRLPRYCQRSEAEMQVGSLTALCLNLAQHCAAMA
jgi:hypothetical protein